MTINKDRQLADCICHALLHLYMQARLSPRKLTRPARNAMLVKHLKPKLKNNRFQSIRSELRGMIHVGRAANGCLEQKLTELNQVAIGYRQTFESTDLDCLYALIQSLEDINLDSQLFTKGEQAEEGVVYLLREHIENGFNDKNQQVAPISLLLRANQETVDRLDKHLNQSQHFSHSLKEHNPDTRDWHWLLHPKEKI